MGKLKTFFHVLIKSHTSPAYYKDLLPVKFSFSLKYFYFYFFLFALIGTIYFGIIQTPPISKFIFAFPDKVQNLYPDELVVTVKDGEISTNVQEPFTIPFTKFTELFYLDNVLGTDTTSLENLVVIDTNGQVEDYVSYSTIVLVTKKIIVWSDSDGTKLFNLEPDMNYTLTKAEIVDVINNIKPFLKYVVPGLIILVFLGLFLFVPSGYLVYLLFFALCLLLLSKILKTGLTYKGCYKLGLHLATIHATVFGVLSMLTLGKYFIGIPFLRTIFLLVIGFFAIRQITPPPAPTPAQPETPAPPPPSS